MKKILAVVLLLINYNLLQAQITMTLGDVNGTAGQIVNVPLDVTNFNNIGSISLRINFDTSVLQYVGLQNAQASFINNAVNDVLTLGWFDMSASNPLNLGNTTIVEIQFNYVGGESDLTFNVAQCEITDNIGTPYAVNYNNGSVSGGDPPAIQAPNLQSPSNGATGQSLTPTLDWSNVTGSTSYGVQISTDGNFTTTLVDQTNITNSEYTVSNGVLQENTTYFWRANATDGNDTSPWSSAYSFTTTAGGQGQKIVALASVQAQEGTQIQVAINVTDFTNIGSISWRISFDTAVLSFVRIENSPITFIANAVSGTLTLAWFDQTAVDPLMFGDGKLGDIVFNYTAGTSNLNFIINQCEVTDPVGQAYEVNYTNGLVSPAPPVPLPPTLLTPENGAADVSLTDELTWSSVSNASTYNLLLASDQNFSNVLVNQTGLVNNNYSVSAGVLNYSTQYFWKVSGTNENGTGEYSSAFSFTTADMPLTPPVLNLPENGSATETLTPTLDWNDVPGASNYEIQIATDGAFADILIYLQSLTSSSYSILDGQLLSGNTYYWRTKAKDGSNISDWSETWSFTAFAGPLAAPNLLTPLNNSENNLIAPSLDWSDVSGAVSYSVQISTNESFTSTVINQSGLTQSNYSVSAGALSYDTKYYWRVNAADNFRESSWSDIWNFRTETQQLSAPSLIAPANNATEQNLTLTLDWNNVTNAATYGVQVSTDENFNTLVIDGSSLPTSDYSIPSGILSENTKYYWRTNASNTQSTSDWSVVWNFTTKLGTSVGTYMSGIPDHFQLNQNYPNPFNPTTKIRYALPETAQVNLIIINLLGQQVAELVNGRFSAGYFEAVFEAGNLSSGTYIFKLAAKGDSGKEYIFSRKMQLVK